MDYELLYWTQGITFLQRELDKEMLMDQPMGFSSECSEISSWT